MTHLYELIAQNVTSWREDGYPCDDYPAIAEILDYARLPDGETLRFLRRAQLRALETYWYLRLVKETPLGKPTAQQGGSRSRAKGARERRQPGRPQAQDR